MSHPPHRHAGVLLREWRERRHLSQLALAGTAAVSTRHLSWIETGRSRPSREMILHLTDRLDVPLRERNRILLAGGFAPVFPEGTLTSDDMIPIRQTLDRLLAAYEPYPALVVDRRWEIVAMNSAIERFLSLADSAVLAPPVNALRATLHPDGLAPSIANLAEWSSAVLTRLDRDVRLSADPDLIALRNELADYPGVVEPSGAMPPSTRVAVPLRLDTPNGRLTFLATQTVFGTPTDVTLAELSVEAFFPFDDETAACLALTGRDERTRQTTSQSPEAG